MSDSPLHYLTIAEAAERIRTRRLSPVELTRAHLDRIEKHDGRVHSYITVAAEAAMAQAKQAEAEIAAGRYRGPLHGIPIAHKDIVMTRGLRTTAHSHVLADWVPDRNATVCDKLDAAGAIMLGKLALHEFAYGTQAPDAPFPAALNPWNTAHTPGSSSSGSGAAVAAGFAMGASGTDTGGSIRHPAAVCGLAGMKATYGRVSSHGVLPLAASLDHLGPMTRTVRDNALMLQALSGYDANDTGSVDRPVPDFTRLIGRSIRGMKLGLPRAYIESAPMDATVSAAFEEALGVLRSLGAEIREIDLPGLAEGNDVCGLILNWEGWQFHRLGLTAWPQKYGENLKKKLGAAERWTDADYRAACAKRERLREAFAGAIRDGYAGFLNTGRETVAMTMEALFADAPDKGSRRLYNLTGMPTLVVPMGIDPNGCPMGLQIAGDWWAEDVVYQIASAYEAQTGWSERHPAQFA